jgi:hypothetical protein
MFGSVLRSRLFRRGVAENLKKKAKNNQVFSSNFSATPRQKFPRNACASGVASNVPFLHNRSECCHDFAGIFGGADPLGGALWARRPPGRPSAGGRRGRRPRTRGSAPPELPSELMGTLRPIVKKGISDATPLIWHTHKLPLIAIWRRLLYCRDEPSYIAPLFGPPELSQTSWTKSLSQLTREEDRMASDNSGLGNPRPAHGFATCGDPLSQENDSGRRYRGDLRTVPGAGQGESE